MTFFSRLSRPSRQSAHEAAEQAALLIESSVVPAQRGDMVTLKGDYADFYGEVIETNVSTGRTHLYLFDTAFQAWRKVWVNSSRVSVLIPGGALTVWVKFPVEVQ